MSETTVAPRRKHVLSNRRLVWLFLVTAIVALVAFFVADNFVIVNVRILTWQIQARLAWVMLTCLVIGVVLGAALALLWRRGRR